MKEKWKQVPGFSRYEISNQGRLRNKTNQHVLCPGIDKYGYEKVSIYDDQGRLRYLTIHRIVALTWLPSKGKKLQVNHKDGVKTNNAVCNLEWVSVRENIIHSFETRLNTNANPIVLTDLKDGTTVRFRSFKSTAKYLHTYSSVMVPLIRMSERYPIYGRYVIRVIDEKAILDRANTTNFGREIYVLDQLTGDVVKYPSVVTASYFTGIRSLSNLVREDRVFNCAGYSVSFSEKNLKRLSDVCQDQLRSEREAYLSAVYVKRSTLFYLIYDYYTKEEFSFKTINEVVEYLRTRFPNLIIGKDGVHSAIGDGRRKSRTGLYAGLGIKFSRYEYDWYPYTEEEILRSRYRTPVRCIYRVKQDDRDFLIFGTRRLCEHFNLTLDTAWSNISEEDVIKAVNIPNLSVVRLNKPLSD